MMVLSTKLTGTDRQTDGQDYVLGGMRLQKCPSYTENDDYFMLFLMVLIKPFGTLSVFHVRRIYLHGGGYLGTSPTPSLMKKYAKILSFPTKTNKKHLKRSKHNSEDFHQNTLQTLET